MASESAFVKAYGLLRKTTPLPVDCGGLCGSRCCEEWEDGVGMYLLPGEEAMYGMDEEWLSWESHSSEDFDFCPSWKGNFWFVKCKGSCPRDKRPFACRTFPLAPDFDEQGTLRMVFDGNGLLICPLIQLSDMDVLNPAFVDACRKAWFILMEDDPLIRDDVEFESERRRVTRDADNSIRTLLGTKDRGRGI